jgi:hypothetical protein
LDPKIYRAAKVKSALTGKPLSTLVNEALIFSLREDQADLSAFQKRRKETSRPFEDVLKDLKRDGLL